MAYIIGAIIVLIALIIVGLILRKRIYDMVDRLESWKMDIMNRNVSTELAKVKHLNLSGETQEKFESWKDNWEEIVSRKLPDIEEYLFDAEEDADRYKIPSAKKNLNTVEEILKGIEKEIDGMLQELEQLLQSEENSRKEVLEMLPIFKGLRKNLLQNHYQFGRAADYFENEIDDLDASFRAFQELTETGNYFEAQGLVRDIREKLEILTNKMEEFPSLYRQCSQELPEQIEELAIGITTMSEEGYRIDQLDYEKELDHYKGKLSDCVEELEQGDMEYAFELVDEVEDRIKVMYQRLEQEALARQYVEKQLPLYEKSLGQFLEGFNKTKEEVEHLQEAYYFEDHDLESYTSLEKWIISLQESVEEIKEDLNTKSVTHTEIKSHIENNSEELDVLKTREQEFKTQINQLRKEELEAKESIEAMNISVEQAKRMLKKSNIPGIPNYIWSLVDETGKKIDTVYVHLGNSPLDMGKIQAAVEEAEKSSNQLIEQVDFMLDQARLTELVIQYANRYRREHPALAKKLVEAETMFRHAQYEEALEYAAAGLQQVDPEALKRLEEYMRVPS